MARTHKVEKLIVAQDNMQAIDEAAVQRGLGTKAYISVAASTIDPDTPVASLITNIDTRLNELVNIAPRNEYFAGNAICASLGYTIINQMLWDYRRKQQAPAAVPDIDIFNDEYADMYERRATDAQMADNGMDSLPTFNAIGLAGVYKRMLGMQRGNTAYSADFPVRMPHELLHEMLTDEGKRQMNEAYEALSKQEIDQSVAAHAIRAAVQTMANPNSERNLNKRKAETEHVLNELRMKVPDMLTDDVWKSIPLWMQYKLTVSVFKQVVKAIALETRKEPNGSATRDKLLALIEEMYLELKAASTTAEIKLAFALDRLDERHDVIAKDVVVVKVEEAVE